MNYRLIISEMIIDYRERMSLEKNFHRRSIYLETIRDLNFILDLEVGEIVTLNSVKEILK